MQKNVTGHMMALEGLESQPTSRDVLRSVPFSLRLLWEADRASIVWKIVGGLLAAAANATYLFAVGMTVDALVSHTLPVVWWGVGLFAFGAVADVISGFLLEHYGSVHRHRTEQYVARRALETLTHLPFHVIEDPRFRMVYDVYSRKNWILMSFADSLMQQARDIGRLFGMLAVVFVLPWQAIVVLLVAQALMLLFGRKIGSFEWNILSMETREGRRGWYYQETLQTPRGLLTARTLGLVRSFYRRWRTIVERILAERIKLSRKTSAARFWSDAVRSVGFIIGLVIVIVDTLEGRTTAGAAAMYISSFELVGGYLRSIVGNITWLQQEGSAFPVFKRFFSLPQEPMTGLPLPKGPLTISFEDVWFRYPGSSADVLRGVSFVFTEADHLALVGLNGAGKSTLLKLLFGVYQPTRGRITVNGTNLAEIKRVEWQRALAILGQDLFAFDDVIREQMRYGDYEKAENASRLKTALWASGMDEVVKDLPHGLETHAGRVYAMPEDRAIELSGGQNQILAIARTIYRDARIYIFDEPTAAVDAEKEERFFDALPEALQSRSVLFVSHRFSTLRRAKRILVVDQGRIIEEGSHDELVAKKGRYAELFALQAKMYQ